MKFAYLFAAAAALLPASAEAAVVSYNVVVDLSNPTTYPGSDYFSVSIPGDPIELHVGDIVTGHLSFADGGRLLVTDNHFLGFSSEQVFLQLLNPIEGAEQGRAVGYYTFDLTGVQGDYTPFPHFWAGPWDGSWNGTLGIVANSDLTASSFTFDGIDFTIEFHEGSSTQFVPGSLWGGGFGTLSVAPPSVPEPYTWAMMLLGFGAIGVQMRRERKPMVVREA